MRLRTTLLAALVVAVLLAGLTTASADDYFVSREDFTASWSSVSFSAAGSTVRCRVVLQGSFHEVHIDKEPGSLIGAIHAGAVPSCTGGRATLLTATLPWHITYVSFTGRLPFIDTVTIQGEGLGIQIDPEGASPACLSRATRGEPLRLIATVEERAVITQIRIDETSAIDLTGDFLCELAGDGTASGTGIVDRIDFPTDGSTDALLQRSDLRLHLL